jgi:hypothetical protein
MINSPRSLEPVQCPLTATLIANGGERFAGGQHRRGTIVEEILSENSPVDNNSGDSARRIGTIAKPAPIPTRRKT